MAKKLENLRLDFGNLPLIEATVRASFSTKVPLTFKFINDVYKRIESRFPTLEEPKQIEVAPGIVGPFQMSPLQITGALFSGNKQGLCVTLQDQVIVARWLKQFIMEGPAYPRFPALREALWEIVAACKKTCGPVERPIHVLNMSYVNFLKLAHTSTVLEKYFSDKVQVQITNSAEQTHKLEIAWRDPDGTDLRFVLEQITAEVEQEKIEGYRLTTAAGRSLSPTDDGKAILDEVHQRLQFFFLDVLSKEARTEWQLEEVHDG